MVLGYDNNVNAAATLWRPNLEAYHICDTADFRVQLIVTFAVRLRK